MAKLRVLSRFGIAPNHLLNDQKFSLKAKGLYTYMQSKPDGWEFSADRISKEVSDGRDSILTALQELEQGGYLQRNKTQNKEGKWEWEHTLMEYPSTENPTTVYPTTEKPTIKKKKDTEKNNISEPSGSQEPVRVVYENDSERPVKVAKFNPEPVYSLFREVLGVETMPWKINKTQRLSAENLSRFSLNKIRSALEFVKENQSEPYFPQVLSPYDLDQKWEALKKKKYGN